jgi:RNA polymerase sigma-70 factor (ECF subfamily)
VAESGSVSLRPGGNGEGGRGVYSWRGRSQSVDRERFEAEVLPFVKRLYGTAYRMTRNTADAEDLVQDTLFRAFRGFGQFRPGTNIRAWLYTILQRARTDALRRAGRRPQTEELLDDGPAVPPSQETLVWGGEAVERALCGVPEVFREAVLLRDVEELSYAEIAAALQVPQGTVMSRIYRGRTLLRSALAGAKP